MPSELTLLERRAINAARELVLCIREVDAKDSVRQEQRENSERSLVEDLEEMLDLVGSNAESMIAATAHAYGFSLERLRSDDTSLEVCRARMGSAQTAVFSGGYSIREVASVLNRDTTLVRHWIGVARARHD